MTDYDERCALCLSGIPHPARGHDAALKIWETRQTHRRRGIPDWVALGLVRDAHTVTEFIDHYYKPDRLSGMEGRRERIIADRENDVRRYGYALISHHDCVTGQTAYFVPPEEA